MPSMSTGSCHCSPLPCLCTVARYVDNAPQRVRISAPLAHHLSSLWSTRIFPPRFVGDKHRARCRTCSIARSRARTIGHVRLAAREPPPGGACRPAKQADPALAADVAAPQERATRPSKRSEKDARRTASERRRFLSTVERGHKNGGAGSGCKARRSGGNYLEPAIPCRCDVGTKR